MSNEAEEFVKALVAASKKSRNQDGLAVNARSGPVLRIPTIEFKDLPPCVAKETQQLMIDLNDSTAPVDRGPATSRGSDVVGAMRQIHTNDPKYLPTNTIGLSNDRTPILSGRSKTYFAYSDANKGHTNDRRDEGSLTGYVEYTAGNVKTYPYAHLSEMRIVFDYVQGRIFLAPFHYQSWKGAAGTFEVVDKPKPDAGCPSPFFWIIEIPKKV